MDLEKYELKPEELRKEVKLNYASSNNLEKIIGQKRAIEALEFGCGMKSPGYNIYASGEHGLGKHSIIEELLKEYACEMEYQMIKW